MDTNLYQTVDKRSTAVVLHCTKLMQDRYARFKTMTSVKKLSWEKMVQSKELCSSDPRQQSKRSDGSLSTHWLYVASRTKLISESGEWNSQERSNTS